MRDCSFGLNANAILDLAIMLVALAGPRAEAAEPLMEKHLPIPSIAVHEYLEYPGWVGFDGRGKYLAAAHKLKDRARLTVWELTTYRVIRDTEISYINQDTDFA